MLDHSFTEVLMAEDGQHHLLGVDEEPKTMFSIKWTDFVIEAPKKFLRHILIILL